MATVAVLADPPVEGVVLPDVVAGTPLTETEAARLYRAMLVDVCRAVQRGGADLLVNYRDPDQVGSADPDQEVPGGADVDSEQRLRETLDGALGGEAARYEVQVGETFAGRAGNTVTHLLEREDEDTVAVVEPTAAFLGREQIGTAAMKLRSSEVVLGPTTGGRVYYAGFAAPVDFTDAYAPPAVETLTRRAREADLDVDFLPMLPVVEQGSDLTTALPGLRARQQAGRNHPERTAAVLDDLGVGVEAGEAGLTVTRGSDSS
jgi:2-phospho-L-lactate guanylyltransferase (CobY/MobA/RfbA family)